MIINRADIKNKRKLLVNSYSCNWNFHVIFNNIVKKIVANYTNLDRNKKNELLVFQYDNIYAPPWGLSTLAKELSAAASVMQSSSKELSTLVADRI